MHKAMVMYNQMKPKVKTKEDKIIESLEYALRMLHVGVLWGRFERFDGNLEDMFEFYRALEELGSQTNYNNDDIISEAKNERTYIYKMGQKIPMWKYLALCGAKNNHSCANMRLLEAMQTGYCIVGVFSDRILESKFDFTLEQRELFFELINNWIDEIATGWLTIEGIREMFIEDASYDVSKGEFVNG